MKVSVWTKVISVTTYSHTGSMARNHQPWGEVGWRCICPKTQTDYGGGSGERKWVLLRTRVRRALSNKSMKPRKEMLFSYSRERQRLPEVFLCPEQPVYSPSNYISVSVLQLLLWSLGVDTIPFARGAVSHPKHGLLTSAGSVFVCRALTTCVFTTRGSGLVSCVLWP